MRPAWFARLNMTMFEMLYMPPRSTAHQPGPMFVFTMFPLLASKSMTPSTAMAAEYCVMSAVYCGDVVAGFKYATFVIVVSKMKISRKFRMFGHVMLT